MTAPDDLRERLEYLADVMELGGIGVAMRAPQLLREAAVRLGEREWRDIASTKKDVEMTDAHIDYMVNRFLGWSLPENFHPDAGITFKRTFNDHLPHPTRHEPTGTNLFDAAQAAAMVRYMLEGLPNTQDEELQRVLRLARPFVEYAYQAEGGEEAAEAKHTLDEIDRVAAPLSPGVQQ